MLARLGVGSDDDDALASLMSGDLLAAYADVEPRMLELLRERGIRPNVMSATARVMSLSAYGGDVVPTRALDAISDGAARGVDLLVGTNLDETALFGPQYASSAPDVADVAFGPRASAVLNQYRARRTGQPAVDAMTSFMTDSLFRIPAIQLAEAAQAHSARTYMYLLAYGSPPCGERRGAMHGLDLPFMWDRLDDVADALFDLAGLERAPELATAMHGAWVAFVTTGAPEHPTLPEWPAYDPLRRATMLLDRQSRVVDDPLGEDRALWDGVEY